jgi:cell division protein ZapA (FtsZ GTPase activity inhibitor)
LEQTVTLQLFGRDFIFQTDSRSPDADKVTANFKEAVHKVESQLKSRTVIVDKETILILAGLNIASEFNKLEKRYHALVDRVTEKAAVVLSELDKVET